MYTSVRSSSRSKVRIRGEHLLATDDGKAVVVDAPLASGMTVRKNCLTFNGFGF